MTTAALLSSLSPSQRAAVEAQLGRKAKPAKPKRSDGYRSKLEADYARHLDALKAAGHVRWWAYEPFKVRLAAGAHFTPDFLVSFADGRLEAHETKGWMREAANVRIKTAADLFPLRFVLVMREGGWSYKSIAGLADRLAGGGVNA